MARGVEGREKGVRHHLPERPEGCFAQMVPDTFFPGGAWLGRLARVGRSAARRCAAVHGDQQGQITILTVFAVLLLTIVLGMVMKAGHQVDDKIRMQNAADAAAYSGGAVLARGVNTLAFTNHLLSDVFALTAFMREARDRHAESCVPPILGAWNEQGGVLAGSGFPKFDRLGMAITEKVPREQQLVTAYSEWASAASARVLPMLEEILAQELIPRYQRAVVEAFPDIAQTAVMEVARESSEPDHGRGPMLGALWRTDGQVVGGAIEMFDRTLPAIDPVTDPLLDRQRYVSKARSQRRSLARRYLSDWNREAMYAFDREAEMSQFGNLWRSFTCGQLERLLEVEYRESNLPMLIGSEPLETPDPAAALAEDYTFVAVVYWKKRPVELARVFASPVEGDQTAFAQVRLFVPRARLIWKWYRPGWSPTPIGGVPGEFPPLPGEVAPEDGSQGQGRWIVGRQSVPTGWNLLNQHWTCQLVPATGPNLDVILQTLPPLPEFATAGIVLPSLGPLTNDDITQISIH